MSHQLKRIYIHQDLKARRDWIELLEQCQIRHEDNVERTYGMYEQDKLIATGSLFENILKCIAVEEDYTGGDIIGQLISHLMVETMERGYSSCFVYTKPKAVDSFQYLGFKEIARIEDTLVFMEKAVSGLQQYLGRLLLSKKEGMIASSIVMNANPFTNGHQYLVEQAARESDLVYVFVLSEDRSFVPASVRLELVKQGVAQFPNVVVCETGSYMVSSSTFPSYFLKEDEDVTKLHARLDATIFKSYIVPTLQLTRRYLGEEPYSIATSLYNEVLQEELSDVIDVRIMKRKGYQEDVISASIVRELWMKGNFNKLKEMVPLSTYEFIVSPQGESVLNRNKEGKS